jgi:hypothetical protein
LSASHSPQNRQRTALLHRASSVVNVESAYLALLRISCPLRPKITYSVLDDML